MASLSLKNVCKVYPNGFVAVKDFNLEIADQEFIIFVGPSGCGKSTTLRMIAGLEEISSGELWIGDKLVNDVEPKDRDIAMVFQNYALYPHMSVYDNMAFGLKLRKVPKDEIDKSVHEAAKILDIEHLLDRKPKALSGGQRQRVAMGRAIVRSPKVFLMDEPLSNLDAKLRVQMRVEISKLHKRLQTTIIYVTHDQTEAMTLGTRIVVLKDGIIQQVDTPQNLYNTPNNIFVAGFIGSPQMNLIDATVSQEGSQAVLKMSEEVTIKLPAEKSKKLIDEVMLEWPRSRRKADRSPCEPGRGPAGPCCCRRRGTGRVAGPSGRRTPPAGGSERPLCRGQERGGGSPPRLPCRPQRSRCQRRGPGTGCHGGRTVPPQDGAGCRRPQSRAGRGCRPSNT